MQREIRQNKWYTVLKKHLDGVVESESLPWPIQQFVSQLRLAASE